MNTRNENPNVFLDRKERRNPNGLEKLDTLRSRIYLITKSYTQSNTVIAKC